MELSVVHPLCRQITVLSQRDFQDATNFRTGAQPLWFPFYQLLPPFIFLFGRRLLFFLFTQMLSGSSCFVCSSLQLPERCRDVLQGREGRQSWLQTSRTQTRNCLVREIPQQVHRREVSSWKTVSSESTFYTSNPPTRARKENFEDDSARIAQCQKARPPSRPATLEDGEEKPFEGSHQGAIILNPRSSNFHLRAWDRL